MDLFDNPFHLLEATSRDNRGKLMDLAEDKSLIDDSELIANARADLTNPRKRLIAEIAWLPGLSPKQVNVVVHKLQENPSCLLEILEENVFPSLAAANLLAAAITRLGVKLSGNDLSKWIYTLAKYHADINHENITILLNEERTISGFPEVSNLALIEEELSNRRIHFRQSIKTSLDALPTNELIATVTQTVEDATDIGKQHAPVLINDMVDMFEVDAQNFLQQETENIITLVDEIRNAIEEDEIEEVIENLISQFEKIVKNWDIVAQPMQVSLRSRGLPHNQSLEVGSIVRGLALYVFNDHGHLNISKRLTLLQQEVFAEVDSLLELSVEDEIALDNIASERKEHLKMVVEQAEEWNNEITYETELGVFFKDKLKISPDGIEYKSQTISLAEIIGVRWGGTKRTVNGVPTGTEYLIVVGTSRNTIRIETKKENVYSNFVERLWKAVGVRLFTELLEGLRNGRIYQFGSANVDDEGMELVRFKIFGENEKVYCPWSDLIIWNGGGTFCLRHKENKKFYVELSYQEEDNIHVFEAAVQAFWKKGGSKLSSLLSDD